MHKDSYSDEDVFSLLTAAVLVKVPSNVYSIEDEKLEINCVVKGTNPTISWEFG